MVPRCNVFALFSFYKETMALLDFLKNDDSLSELEASLRSRGSRFPQLSKNSKSRLKERLLHSVRSSAMQKEPTAEPILVDALKNLSEKIRPDPVFRLMLKEKLTLLREFDRNRGFLPKARSAFLGWSGSLRQFSAVAMGAIFLATLVLSSFVSPQVTEASYKTLIQGVDGEVTVTRGGESFPVEPGFVLLPDDVVQTGVESGAILRFLDQSVSRLGSNTEVKLLQLGVNPRNTTETFVEVSLTKGRLWSRVINLVSVFSRFQVNAANAVAVAKRKAAFDVNFIEDGRATVSAFQNSVDLLVANTNRVVETTLVRGYSAEVGETGSTRPLISQISDGDTQEDQWVQNNLSQDERYIATIKAEAQGLLRDGGGLVPGDVLYSFSEFSDETRIALSPSPLERQKRLLSQANKKLGEAEALYASGQTRAAELAVGSFKRNIEAVADWIREHQYDGDVRVGELRNQMREVIGSHQKQLSLVLPSEELYALKEVIAETRLNIAQTTVEKTQGQLEFAAQKLLEAHDLAQQGDSSAAQRQVEAYSKKLDQLVEDLKVLPREEREKAVSVLLDAKFEDIKVLESIRAPLKPVSTPVDLSALANDPTGYQAERRREEEEARKKQLYDDLLSAGALKESIAHVRTDSLAKLGEAVLDVRGGQLSPEVIEKLEAIQSFDVNGKSILDVRLIGNRVIIRTDTQVISVTGPARAVQQGDTDTTTEVKERGAAPELPELTLEEILEAGHSASARLHDGLPVVQPEELLLPFDDIAKELKRLPPVTPEFLPLLESSDELGGDAGKQTE